MIKIDEIMHTYPVNIEDYPEDSLTEEERKRIYNSVLTKAGISSRPIKLQRLRSLLIACVIILAAFTISFATYQYALSDNARNYFQPQNEQQIEALNTIGTTVDKKVSFQGLTVHVKEIIGDQHTVNVLFDVILPEDFTPRQRYYNFENNHISFQSATSMGWGITTLHDDNLSDNVIPFILFLDAEKKITKQQITLYLENFGYEEELLGQTGGFVPVIQGSWEISFPLNYHDVSIQKTVNQKVLDPKYDGFRLKEITLSPISANIKLTKSFTSFIEQGKSKTSLSGDANTPTEYDFKIYLKNGNQVEPFDDFSSIGTSSTSTKTNINFSFDNVIDLNDVAYVEFMGVRVDYN